VRGTAAIAAVVVCACGSHGSDDHAPAAVVVDAMPPALVQINADAVTVRGKRVAGVHGGMIDDADVETSDWSRTVPRLRDAITAAALRPGEVVTISADASIHYRAFTIVAGTLLNAHVEHMTISCPTGSPPIDLPSRPRDEVLVAESHTPRLASDPEPSPPPDASPPPEPTLGMAVAITQDRLIVFSLSRLEGSLPSPKVEVPRSKDDAAVLQRTLREIVDRRWGHGEPRSDADRSLVLMADPSVALPGVIAIARATHAAADGTPLFPVTYFSAGFE
jgi:hypothetical protein